MQTGPKPQPSVLKILRGNPGKRPLNGAEPKFRRKIPPAPEILQGEARKAWKWLTKKLFEAGVLTEIDGAALAMYCQAWERWLMAESQIRQFGAVMFSKKDKTPFMSPYLGVSSQAMKQMTRLLLEFGMTPSSRTGIHADTDGEDEGLSMDARKREHA